MPRTQRSIEQQPILVAFYCNKGGVGKTTLLHNMAYLFAQNRLRVLAVDADPQCNLSNQLLKTPDSTRLDKLKVARSNMRDIDRQTYDFDSDPESLVSYFYDKKPTDGRKYDIYECFEPLIKKQAMQATANLAINPDLVVIQKTRYENLYLLPGNTKFSKAGIGLGEAYSRANDDNDFSGKIRFSAYTQYIRKIAKHNNIQLVFIDLNPGMSGLNATYILSSDYFFIPTQPDCFTRQTLQELCTEFPDWVKETDPFREDQNTEFSVGLPSKFLGYVSLKFPVRKQAGEQDDVVKAYNKWWTRIHDVVFGRKGLYSVFKGITSNGRPSPMVSQRFMEFKYGIKNFASLGENTQETGVPIADLNGNSELWSRWVRRKDNLKDQEYMELYSRKHYRSKFSVLMGFLLHNMGPEAVHKLGLASVLSSAVSVSLFGCVKETDSFQTLRDENGDEYNLYFETNIDSNAIHFNGLPFVYDSREIAKNLLIAFNKGNESAQNEYAQEIVNLSLELYKEYMNNNDEGALRKMPTFIRPHIHRSATKPRDYNEKAVKYLKHLYQIFSAHQHTRQQDTDFQRIYSKLVKLCQQEIPKLSYQKDVTDENNNKKVKKLNFFETYIEHGNLFAFNIKGLFEFNEITTHLLKAILESVEDYRRFQLNIWELASDEEGQCVRKFCYPENQALKLHVLHEVIENKSVFRLMVPRTELEYCLSLGQQSFEDESYQYTDHDMKILLQHFITNDVCCVLDAQSPLASDRMESDPKEKFKNAIIEAFLSNKSFIMPVNTSVRFLDQASAYSESIGDHWVVLYAEKTSDYNYVFHYLDSFGDMNSMPDEISEAASKIKRCIRQAMTLQNANQSNDEQIQAQIMHNNAVQQTVVTNDCGRFAVANAIRMTQGLSLVSSDDIENLRDEYAQVLREFYQAQRSASSASVVEELPESSSEAILLSRSASQAGLTDSARQSRRSPPSTREILEGLPPPRTNRSSRSADCAYETFGISRNEAVNLLSSQMSINPRVKEILQNLFKSRILENVFKKYLIDNGYHETTIQNVARISEDSAALSMMLKCDILDCNFENSMTDPAILHAIAVAKKINLYIWRKENQSFRPHLRARQYDYFHLEHFDNQDEVHILYRNSHYERMEGRDIQAAKQQNRRAFQRSDNNSLVAGLHGSSSHSPNRQHNRSPRDMEAAVASARR